MIGNDISLPRLKITKNLLKKYNQKGKIFLLNQDARQLPLTYNTAQFKKTELEYIYTYDNSNPSKDTKITKVLVDVECSHDGSLKHMLKYFTSKQLKKKLINSNQPEFIISNKEKKRRAKLAEQAKTHIKSISSFFNPEKINGPLRTSRKE